MACTLTLTTMGAITSMFNTQNPLMKKRGSNCLKPVDQYLFFILKNSKVFLFVFENIQRPAQHRRCFGHLKGDLLSFACKPSTIQKIILLSLERPAPLEVP